MHRPTYRFLPLALLPALGACSLPSLSVTPRAQLLEISGEIAASNSSVRGGSDTGALGLEDDEPVVFAPRIDFEVGPTHWTLDGLSSEWSGSGRAEQQITIGGVVINLGADVDTDIELDFIKLGTTWDFAPTSIVELGIGVGLALLDFSGRITEPTSGQSEAASVTTPLPMLAARASVDVGDFEVGALLSGLAIDLGDDEVSWLDLDVSGSYVFASAGLAGSVALGYRWIEADVEFEDGGDEIAADLGFRGPYIGVSLSF